MSFSTTTLEAITNQHTVPEVVDNAFNGEPFAWFMREQGRVTIKGGTQISQPILKDDLNSEMYATGLEPATLEATEIACTATWQWKWARVMMVIPEEEIDKNSGDDGIVDIVETYMETAKLSAMTLLGTNLHGTNASDTKFYDGLQNLFGASGTAYAGLTDTSFTSPANWLTYIHTPLSAAVLSPADLRHMRGNATYGNAKPNLGLCNFPVYGKIWTHAEDNQRFGQQKTADMGFEHVMFEGMPIIADDGAPGSGLTQTDNWLMFLNTDYLKLIFHANKVFVSKVYAPVAEFEAYVAKIKFGGNLMTSKRGAHAVCKTFDPAD